MLHGILAPESGLLKRISITEIGLSNKKGHKYAAHNATPQTCARKGYLTLTIYQKFSKINTI